QVSWEGRPEAGPLGVRLSGVQVVRGGTRAEFTEASARPTLGGLVASLRQAQGRASVRLNHRDLALQADSIEVETGNADLGKAEVTVERFTYSLASREGQGEVRMVLPKLSAPLPIPVNRLELGAPVQIRPAKNGAGTEITAELRVSGEGLSGSGSVMLRTAPNQPAPALSGVLNLETKLGNVSIRLGGTWAKPTWEINPG
ncbi:MAG: hypothetical protein AB1758_20325, partial [Candidatus Eremiobacterota bacterium]